MTYALVIIGTILVVLVIFYFIGKKVEKKKEMLYDQYFKQMEQIHLKKRSSKGKNM